MADKEDGTEMAAAAAPSASDENLAAGVATGSSFVDLAETAGEHVDDAASAIGSAAGDVADRVGLDDDDDDAQDDTLDDLPRGRVAVWKRRMRVAWYNNTSSSASTTDLDNVEVGSEDLYGHDDTPFAVRACLCLCTPLCATARCACYTCGAIGDDHGDETMLSLPMDVATMHGQLDDDKAALEFRDPRLGGLESAPEEQYKPVDRDLSEIGGYELLTSVVEPNQLYAFWWQRYVDAGLRPPTERAFSVRDPMVNLSPPPRSFCIANSGGGVRSGAFCLGAWQTLGEHDKVGMHRVEYVSSVSGGGYTASAYMSHLCRLRHMRMRKQQFEDDRAGRGGGNAVGTEEFAHAVDQADQQEMAEAERESPDEAARKAADHLFDEAEADRNLKRRALDHLSAQMPLHGEYMSLLGQLMVGVLGPFLMNAIFAVSLAMLLAVFADAIGIGDLLRAAEDGTGDFYLSDYFYIVMFGSALAVVEGLFWVGREVLEDPWFCYQHLLPHGKVGTLLGSSVVVYACVAWGLAEGRAEPTTTVAWGAAAVGWIWMVSLYHTVRRPEFEADRARRGRVITALKLALPGLATVSSFFLVVATFAASSWWILVETYTEGNRDDRFRYLAAAALVGLSFVQATADVWTKRVGTHYRRSLRQAFYARDTRTGRVYDPKMRDTDELLPTGPYWVCNVTYNGFSPLPEEKGANEARAIDRSYGAVQFTPVCFGSPDFGYTTWDSVQTRMADTRISKAMALSAAAFSADFGRLSAKLGVLQQLVAGCTGAGLGDWVQMPTSMTGVYDTYVRRYINKWQPVVYFGLALGVWFTEYSHWKWIVAVVVIVWLFLFLVSLWNPHPPAGTGCFLNRASRYLRHLSPMVRLFHSTVLHHVARETLPEDLSMTDGGHQENLGVTELLRRRRQHIFSFNAEGGPPHESLRKVIGAAVPFQARRGLVYSDAARSLAWLHHDLVVDCDVAGVHFLAPPGALDPEDQPFSATRLPQELQNGQPYYLFRLRYYLERAEDGTSLLPEDAPHGKGTSFPVDPVPLEGRPGFSVVDGWMLYVNKNIDPEAAPESVRRPRGLRHSRSFPDHPTWDQYSYDEDAFSAYQELGRQNTEAALRKYGDLFLAGPPPPVSAEVHATLHRRMWEDKVDVNPKLLGKPTPVKNPSVVVESGAQEEVEEEE